MPAAFPCNAWRLGGRCPLNQSFHDPPAEDSDWKSLVQAAPAPHTPIGHRGGDISLKRPQPHEHTCDMVDLVLNLIRASHIKYADERVLNHLGHQGVPDQR